MNITAKNNLISIEFACFSFVLLFHKCLHKKNEPVQTNHQKIPILFYPIWPGAICVYTNILCFAFLAKLIGENLVLTEKQRDICFSEEKKNTLHMEMTS